MVEKDYLKWQYRFELIKQNIKQLDPDIIGLCEVDVMPLYKQISEAMAKLGFADYFCETKNGTHG